MIGLYVIGIVVMLISLLVSNRLKSKFKYYSQISLKNGMSGKEIAERMLSDFGIKDVKVISVNGQLTDHYNPIDKTVNLSEAVYDQRNAAAAAVAAHECGHAVQHAEAYHWLGLRSKLAPAVTLSASMLNMFNMVLIVAGGFFLSRSNPIGDTLILILIAANMLVTVFALITLPVEFDASRRALAWMQNKNIVTSQEYEGSKDSLKWAALTYVVAALGAIANLVYYISLLVGRRD
ncbi:MAG: zinc metallopeptidase [Bacteroidia bacterium]|nr:zinc metallopeptidase [Bacteroidia bacterium]